ncbi:hypothetical protein AAMO2058_000065600 [Amorphochlora amoebiformis]
MRASLSSKSNLSASDNPLGETFQKWYKSHCKRIQAKYAGPGLQNAINRRLNHPLTAVIMGCLLFFDILTILVALTLRLASVEQGYSSCKMQCDDMTCEPGTDFQNENLNNGADALTVLSLMILMVFGLETIIRILVNPNTYFCSFYNILDFCIVWISIIVELTLFSSAAGLLIVARTWRFVRDIVGSLITGISYGRGNNMNDRILDPKKIHMEKKIGSGHFGETYLATYNNQDVVVKVPHHGTGDLGELISFIKIKEHPNVVSFLGITTKNEKLCPVTRFYNLGSLDNLHEMITFSSWPIFLRIALDITSGVRHLHEVLNILHRDIRCANVFLEGSTRSGANGIKAVLGDWGLAKGINTDKKTNPSSENSRVETSPDELVKVKKRRDEKSRNGIESGRSISGSRNPANTQTQQKMMFTIPESPPSALKPDSEFQEDLKLPDTIMGNSELYDNVSASMFYKGTGSMSVSPWPWTAPEAWVMGIFNKASDIYMVGVTFWELLTKGADPYHWRQDYRPNRTLHQVMVGTKRLKIPSDVPLIVYCLVRSCLDPNPVRRPSADLITKWLKAMIRMQERLQHRDGILAGVLQRQKAKAASGTFLRGQRTVSPPVLKLGIPLQSLLHRAFVNDFYFYSEQWGEEKIISKAKEYLTSNGLSWTLLLGEVSDYTKSLEAKENSADLDIDSSEYKGDQGQGSLHATRLRAMYCFLKTYHDDLWVPPPTIKPGEHALMIETSHLSRYSTWRVWMHNLSMFQSPSTGEGGELDEFTAFERKVSIKDDDRPVLRPSSAELNKTRGEGNLMVLRTASAPLQQRLAKSSEVESKAIRQPFSNQVEEFGGAIVGLEEGDGKGGRRKMSWRLPSGDSIFKVVPTPEMSREASAVPPGPVSRQISPLEKLGNNGGKNQSKSTSSGEARRGVTMEENTLVVPNDIDEKDIFRPNAALYQAPSHQTW